MLSIQGMENLSSIRPIRRRATQSTRRFRRASLRSRRGLRPLFMVNERDAAWVDAQCTPHPIATMTQTVTLTGARERIAKRSYIRAATYPNEPFDAAKANGRAQRLSDFRRSVRPRRDDRSAGAAGGNSSRSGVTDTLFQRVCPRCREIGAITTVSLKH